MDRVKVFDFIRVVSMFFIFICHCLMNFGSTLWLSRFLGQTFNFLFIILSALLFGLSWEKNNKTPYNLVFMKKRFFKLAKVYYPFLFFMFMTLLIVGQKFYLKDILLHIVFLPWLDKIAGFEHLWYITMIVFCYIAIYISSKIKLLTNNKILFVLLIISILLQIIIDRFNLPGYCMIYMFLYVFTFLNSNKILCIIKNIKITNLYIVNTIIYPIILLMYYYGIHKNMTISVWLGIISAILFFISIFRITLTNFINDKWLNFLSNISFEFYLVHHALCLSSFSLFSQVNNPIFSFISAFILSILFAIILHSMIKNKRLLSV